jgi:hypothetical protein
MRRAAGYNVNNMVFSKPEVGNIPGSAMNFQRIRISTKNPDGTIGDLVVPTETIFSFGVQENTDMASGAVNGYTMPLCLWNKDGPSTEEKAFSDKFDEIVEHIKSYVIDHRDDIEKYDLEMADLKKFNPLYWKRERGQVVEGRGPTLYAKLLVSKKDGNRIMTTFYDADSGEEIEDPMELLKNYCYVNAAIKFESIFIGTKVSLQVKLYEASVKMLSSGPKRLLKIAPRPTVQPTLTFEEEEEDSDAGSISNSSDDDETKGDETPPPVEKVKTPPAPKKRGRKKAV